MSVAFELFLSVIYNKTHLVFNCVSNVDSLVMACGLAWIQELLEAREHALHHFVDTDTSTWQDGPRAVHPVYGASRNHNNNSRSHSDNVMPIA